MQKKLETCPYVNRHKFCPKCGQDNPKVCLEALEADVVERTSVEPEVSPIGETLTFSKPKGRGKR